MRETDTKLQISNPFTLLRNHPFCDLEADLETVENKKAAFLSSFLQKFTPSVKVRALYG